MKSSVTLSPDAVPVLSRGRHRTPRSGACFMEFASFLAGERWSDHPSCTDASLAHLARGVNDLVGSAARARLTVLIPSVIGLTDPQERFRLIVAVRAGVAALPIASQGRQRTIAVALHHLLTQLSELDPELAESLERSIRSALALVPTEEAWARQFRASTGVARHADLRVVTQTLTSISLVGIADACVSEPDRVLVELLETTIGDCAAVLDVTGFSRTADRVFATV